MLWQRQGGLQVQLSETLAAVKERGFDARVFDTLAERLEDFDVIHVFGAINGNERIVAAARAAGVAVVVSPVLHPPFSRRDARRARLATRVTGRLTGWQFTTGYEQVRRAVTGAGAVVALGEAERQLLVAGYGVAPSRLHVIPNGIAERFRCSDARAFREATGIEGPFLLQVGTVTDYKNQLASARLARHLDKPLVLIGPSPGGEAAYLEACREAAGGRLHALGALAADSELMASAYTAAELLLLPSRSEVMPLVVLEALAAGTPAVMTRHSSLVLDDPAGCVRRIEPTDDADFAAAVRAQLTAPPAAADCRALVAEMSWPAVADALIPIYREVAGHA